MIINKLLTPYNHTPSTIDRIQFIVVHYVGATGSAKANCTYYASAKRNASAHYFIDFDGSIWQSVEDQNIAWSVGGKKYSNTFGGSFHGICTNANSLNIEMCVKKKENWYFEQATVDAAIELTSHLMDKYHIDSDHVIRHYDVTGKSCPEPYVRNENDWIKFKSSLSVIRKSGWEQEGSKWKFYLGDTGICIQNDWYQDHNKWYFFGPDSYMCTGKWISYKDKFYYLKEDGTMAVNAYVRSKDPKSIMYYWVNSDGIYEEKRDTEHPDLSRYSLAE